MVTRERPVRRRSPAALGLLAVVLAGNAASAQQTVPQYRGAAPRTAPPAASPVPAERPRMGLLEFSPRRVDSSGHVVVVGGVAKSMVIRSQRATVSLDSVIQRAGGLSREATGAVTIIRHGQPRMNLFYSPGAGTTVIPGDTVIVSARPAASLAGEPTPAAGAAPVAVICHNIQPQPAILWIPESQASVEGITRALGQSLAAIPPRGVVLPAARPTISPDMVVATGTSFYFEPTQIDRARLAQSLASGLRFDEVVDLEASTASIEGPAPSGASGSLDVSLPAADPSRGQLLVPTAPEAAPPVESFSSLAPPTAFPSLSTPSLPLATTPPVGETLPGPAASPAPFFEPVRVQSTSSQHIEMVRDSSNVAASLETVVPDKPSLNELTVAPSREVRISQESAPSTVNRQAFGWGLAAGVLVGALVGVYLWVRSRPKTKKPPGIADLPISEEPASIRPQPLHGKVVADRRLAFDTSHEKLAGPHFGAGRQTKRRPLVRTGAGAAFKAGSTGSAPGSSGSAGETPRVQPEPEGPAPSGLLDRILKAVQRERGE